MKYWNVLQMNATNYLYVGVKFDIPGDRSTMFLGPIRWSSKHEFQYWVITLSLPYFESALETVSINIWFKL